MKRIILTLLIIIMLTSASAQFMTKTRYDADLKIGEQSVTFNQDTTYVDRITVNMRKSLDAKFTVYRIQGEPTQRYILARNVIQYVTVEEPQINENYFTSAKIHFSIPHNAARNIPISSVALFGFDPYKNKWVHLPTISHGLVGDYYTFTATTSFFGYFAIALVESQDLLPATLIPSSTEPAQEEQEETLPAPTVIESEEEREPQIHAPQAQEEHPSSMLLYLIIGFIALLGIGAAVGFYMFNGNSTVPKKMKKEAKKAIPVEKNTDAQDMERVRQMLASTQVEHKEVFAEKKEITPKAVFNPLDYDIKLKELQNTLSHIEGLSQQASTLNRKKSKQVKSIAEQKANELAIQVDEMEPVIVQQFIRTALDSGKSSSYVSKALIDAGYEEHMVSKYLKEASS